MKYEKVKLKELCVVNQGLQIPISERYKELGENRYFYITVQFLKDSGDKYYIDNPPKSVTCTEDEILVVRTGNTGQVITGVSGCFHNNFFKVTPNDKVFPKYLYYALNNKQMHDAMLNAASGTTIPDLKHSSFYNLEIPLPEISIQMKIAKILDNICTKLKLNNEINNNLHELEKNLYKEYFKNLDDDNTQKLGELCKIKYGKGLPTTKIETEGYPVYGGNGMIGYYHEFMYEKSQVLISCRGAASGNVIVSKPQSFVTNNSLILECDRKYHHYLKQYSLNNYYYEYTTGSAQPQITIDNIKDISLNIPSEELLNKFNEQMEPLENKYFSNLEEICKLEQLRDTLLPKLMNGEIDLDIIEI